MEFNPTMPIFGEDKDDLAGNQDFMGIGLVQTMSSKKSQMALTRQEKELDKLLDGKIQKDTTTHIISNGNVDVFTFIPYLIKQFGQMDKFYISTWIISLSIMKQIDKLLISGDLKSINLITDLMFKNRKTDMYAAVLGVVKKHGGKIKIIRNHAKITLLQNKSHSFIITSSANYTRNPRSEQFTLSESKELFDFYENWFKEVMDIK